MTDLFRIAPRHEAIDERLCEWSRWVRVRPQAWATQPMFRYAKSNSRQWEIDPVIPVTINSIAAHEVEKAVARLPEKHRTAIRWAYVHSHIPDARIRAALGLTRDALAQVIEDGRDMVKNVLSVDSNKKVCL